MLPMSVVCRVTFTHDARTVHYACRVLVMPERPSIRLLAPIFDTFPGEDKPFARLYLLNRLLMVRMPSLLLSMVAGRMPALLSYLRVLRIIASLQCFTVYTLSVVQATGDLTHGVRCGIRIVAGEIMGCCDVDLRFASSQALAHVAFKFCDQVHLASYANAIVLIAEYPCCFTCFVLFL